MRKCLSVLCIFLVLMATIMGSSVLVSENIDEPDQKEGSVALLKEAIHLIQENKLEEALITLMEVELRDENNALSHYYMGIIFFLKGDSEREINKEKKAIEKDQFLYDAHLSLAHTLLENGNIDEAMKEYHWCIAINPDEKGAIYNLALIYKEMGYLEEAIILLKRYLELDPDGFWSALANDLLKQLEEK